jgi:hypothetical protein
MDTMQFLLYKLLEKPHFSKYGYLVQGLIFIAIILNIAATFLPEFLIISPEQIFYYKAIETITTYFFIVELSARYISIGEDTRYSRFYGRLKFTFTFYTLIDILVIMLFFLNIPIIFLRFLRFLKLLKILRTTKILKKFINLSAFASANLLVQSFILFSLSVIFIYLFTFAYKDTNTSISIFLDPPSLVEAENFREKIFGIFELIIGLVIAGTLISIITETLATISQKIKEGYLPFNGKEHIVIVNSNQKLDFILQEIENYSTNVHTIIDVVIFLPNHDDIEKFRENLPKLKHIDIVLVTGELFNWNSYERLNINFAKKTIVLKDENDNYSNQKLVRYIITNKHFNNENLEFIIETNDDSYAPTIYEQIFFKKNHKYVLVNYQTVVERFLNRSIVNPEYFKIFLELLTFDGYIIDIIKANTICDESMNFQECCLRMKDGVLIGISDKDNSILNPAPELSINLEESLIIIKDVHKKVYLHEQASISTNTTLSKPKVKVDKHICIVGNYSDIDVNNIVEFLSEYSIENIKYIVETDDEYRKIEIWNNIIVQGYDAVILNLEDDYEYHLTLYLQKEFRNNKIFLNCIVNIMHNPVNAMLLEADNIILSQKLIGRYISQIVFNPLLDTVFSELTTSDGNEIYIIERDISPEYFQYTYLQLKNILLNSEMVYIGILKNKQFTLDGLDIESSDKIIVLAQGR